ncbi:MAG: HD domain-containing protein, partial [Anaerolineae bacterium]
VLRAAAYLHDIAVPLDKARHYELGARLARGLLGETGASQKETEAIVHAIEAHSRYGGPDPQTLEARVLYDADTVEFVGAIGLARGIVRAMESGDYRSDVRQLPALVDRMIAQVEGLQHTEQGAAMADGRIAWLREYKARLEAELRGDL